METHRPSTDEADRRASPPIGRAAHVVAGLVAAVPLLVLGAAAPGGDSWRWLELPAHMTMIAAVLGIASCFARSRGIAVVVLLGTVAGALLWELVREYVGLRGLGRMELFRDDLPLIVSNTVKLLAPWLLGGIYGALAWLAIPRSPRVRADRVHAALWLAGVGIVAIVLTVNNASWLTLENLGNQGTFRSSASWPDTKVLSLVVDALVVVASAVLAVRAWRATRNAPSLPRATLREP